MKEREQRDDGWANLLTLLGTVSDSRTKTKFSASSPLTEQEIDAVYTENGVCRRIIEAFPKHGTRRWMTFENDNDGRFSDEIKRLRTKAIFREAAIEARTNGGAIVVIYTNSGTLGDELDLKTAGAVKVTGLEVFDCWSAKVTERFSPEDGENSNLSGKPKIYECYRWDGSHATVHASRTLYFDGARCSPRRRKLLAGFGDSVLTSIYDSARAYGASLGYVENLVQSYDVPVINVEGLAAAIGSGNEKKVQKRFSIMNLGRSMLNMIILDKEEKYERKAASLTSIPEVLDRFATKLSADSGIPIKILMGTSPAGLQATGDADIRSFYDEVSSYQSDELEPNLDRLIEIIVTGIPPEDDKLPAVKWLPLWEQDEKTAAETRKIQAETDAIYIDKGVISPEETREARFVNGGGLTMSVESTMETEGMEPEEPEDPEEIEAPEDGGTPDKSQSGETGGGE